MLNDKELRVYQTKLPYRYIITILFVFVCSVDGAERISPYLRQWSVLGPFPVVSKENPLAQNSLGKMVEDEAFISPPSCPSLDGQHWQEINSDTDEVDFEEIYQPLRGYMTYAHTYVNSPERQEFKLMMGSPNRMAVWLNGQPVYRKESAGGVAFDGAHVEVTLRKGWNRILVKSVVMTNDHAMNRPWMTFPWWISLRFEDTYGLPIYPKIQVGTPEAMEQVVSPPGVWYRPHPPEPKTLDQVGLLFELFFQNKDIQDLRGKIQSGRPAACAEMLDKIATLYLRNVRPNEWDFDRIDEDVAQRIEKVLVRLSFQYLLTEQVNWAELARQVAIKTCQLTRPDDARAEAGLVRGLACVLDWTGNTLSPGEKEFLLARLPADFLREIKSPAETLSVDLRSQDWVVASGDEFGADFKLGAVMGPPACWYALKSHSDSDMQWLGEQIFQEFPSQSAFADEVWTIIHYDGHIQSVKPSGYSNALEKQAVERRHRRLAAMIEKHRQGPWLPFERDGKQPIRKELLGKRPRLLITPDRKMEVILRAASIPEKLWQPYSRNLLNPEETSPCSTRGYIAHQLVSMAASYLATGQDFYAEQGIHVMSTACDYPHWGQGGGEPYDYDMTGGGMLYGMGVGYDALWSAMTSNQRQRVREKLTLQARRLYHHWSSGDFIYHMLDDGNYSKGDNKNRGNIPWQQNHAFVAAGGLWCTAAALYEEVPEARNIWYDFGAHAIKRGMYAMNSRDGVYLEWINYWAYAMAGNFIPFLDLFRNATGMNTFDYFRHLEKEKYFLLYTMMPGGHNSLNMGETTSSLYIPSPLWPIRTTMLKAASEYQDSEAQGLADYCSQLGIKPYGKRGRLTWWDPFTGDAYRTLLWWDPTVKPVDPRTKWPSYHHFTDFDMVCIRSSWDDDATHFALRCGPPAGQRATQLFYKEKLPDWYRMYPNHNQNDINGFVIFDHGEHLAVDTGYPNYGNWENTREHNTVAVDGGGQPYGQWHEPWDRFGRIGEFFPAENVFFYLRGQGAGYYREELQLTRFDRNVMMIPDPDNTYFVIYDQLESDQEHSYEWLVHSISAATISDKNARYTIKQNKRAMSVHMLSPQGVHAKNEKLSTRIFPWSAKPDRGGSKLVLSPPAKKYNQDFLAVLTLHAVDETGPTVVKNSNHNSFQVKGSDWTDTIVVNDHTETLNTDGAYAFVRHDNDNTLLRWAAVSAGRLSYNDQKLLSFESFAGVTPDKSSQCSAAACYEAGGVQFAIEADTSGYVSLHVPFSPLSCSLDGQPISTEYDRGTKLVNLYLPAGRHDVLILDQGANLSVN